MTHQHTIDRYGVNAQYVTTNLSAICKQIHEAGYSSIEPADDYRDKPLPTGPYTRLFPQRDTQTQMVKWHIEAINVPRDDSFLLQLIMELN